MVEPVHLKRLGIQSSLMQRKMMRWIREGFPEFDSHLANSMKENIPPLPNLPNLNRKSTKERTQALSFNAAPAQACEPARSSQEMLIRSCEGNIAAFYVMRGKVLTIGRTSNNTVRSLEISIDPEHAEIFRMNDHCYLRDKGS